MYINSFELFPLTPLRSTSYLQTTPLPLQITTMDYKNFAPASSFFFYPREVLLRSGIVRGQRTFLWTAARWRTSLSFFVAAAEDEREREDSTLPSLLLNTSKCPAISLLFTLYANVLKLRSIAGRT